MIAKLKALALSIAALSCLLLASAASAQEPATIRGTVADPSGAVIPGATVSLAGHDRVQRTNSGSAGTFAFNSLPPGTYTVTVAAKGFAPFTTPDVILAAGATKDLKVSLAIAVEQEHVTVDDQSENVGLSPDQNSSALVIKGGDLDALSDDPDELQNELQALAGPAAGPNGGQIYIDGFEGGQIPPKSSILEIRVNQNPFSAEFDRIGYGRIEIITKPGSQKLKGSFGGFGTASPLNTANPLVPDTPFYDFYSAMTNVSGPLGKKAAYFFNLFDMQRQTQSIINALNPADPSTNILEAFPNPSSIFQIGPRVDFQLGPHNISIRDGFFRSVASGGGVGILNLPSQATSTDDTENALQIGDTIVINEHLVNETHFQWRRIRNDQTAANSTPAVTVQGAFTDGGSSTGVVQDHQDDFELQNYSTETVGKHVLRFGTRLRAEHDVNSSTSGTNGTYSFSTLAEYEAQTPTLYSQTVVNNPVARATLFDAALFLQDDWRPRNNLVVGLGLRYEAQNWINDHADWGPRLAFAWSPGFTGKGAAKTVVRAGYGWFYNRFTVPNSFQSSGTPYVIQTIHDNLVNEKSYTVTNPNAAFPNNQFNASAPAPIPASLLASTPQSTPTYHTIDPHFHAALDMQGGLGVDRQLTKALTGNITFLYTQGVHQYLTDNVTSPDFDPSTYTVNGPTPAAYNYQFQSGGFYRQQQLILTAKGHFKHLSFDSNYTLNYANSDTQGATSIPMIDQNPGFDYGRASFDTRNRAFLLLTYTAPGGVIFAPLLSAQSGTPYNITIGNDLTQNNQFNARPTFATCSPGNANVVSTPYGCLDANPYGKNEKIIPYNLGTGPANFVLHMRASKTIGIGPHIKQEGDLSGQNVNNSVNGRGLSGNGGGVKIDEKVPRKYNITFVAIALNVFNVVNWAPPNGVIDSRLFGQTQSLAGGPYSGPTPGNRTILFFTNFSF
ncbi:MAG TPA: carboxypeptidase regulatory-like domain-containing protein [Acidobacteriaceae bacterium]|nr:carboxypeptidase regulatory-like domain-containing protein [Acidobacteriaceae bacterium]